MKKATRNNSFNSTLVREASEKQKKEILKKQTVITPREVREAANKLEERLKNMQKNK